MAKKLNRFEREALTQGQLRFGAQEYALAQLLSEARGDRNQSIKAAEGAARGTKAAVQAARQPLRQAYFEAGTTRQDANADVDRILGSLGGGNPLVNLVTAASARERGAQKTQIATDQANALGELVRRGVDAQTAASANRVQADRQYRGAKSKIRDQAVQLAGEKGLFTTQTLNNLLGEHRDQVTANRKLAQDDRRLEADLTGVDPVTGEPTAEERNRTRDDERAAEKERRARKKSPYSLESRVSNKDRFEKAVNMAVTWRDAQKPATEAEIRQLLESKNIPPLIALAAAQTAIGGGAGGTTKKQVKDRYGIAVPIFTPQRNAAAKRRHQKSRSRYGVPELVGPLVR